MSLFSPRKLLLLPVLAVLAAHVAVPAHGLQALSAQELASHCAVLSRSPGSRDGQYCIRYVQGFVDGAVATDARVRHSREADRTPETITQRAMRTRMVDRGSSARRAGDAEFCLGAPVGLEEVVQQVVTDLKAHGAGLNEQGSARELVYASLRRHYPCTEG